MANEIFSANIPEPEPNPLAAYVASHDSRVSIIGITPNMSEPEFNPQDADIASHRSNEGDLGRYDDDGSNPGRGELGSDLRASAVIEGRSGPMSRHYHSILTGEHALSYL